MCLRSCPDRNCLPPPLGPWRHRLARCYPMRVSLQDPSRSTQPSLPPRSSAWAPLFASPPAPKKREIWVPAGEEGTKHGSSPVWWPNIGGDAAGRWLLAASTRLFIHSTTMRIGETRYGPRELNTVFIHTALPSPGPLLCRALPATSRATHVSPRPGTEPHGQVPGTGRPHETFTTSHGQRLSGLRPRPSLGTRDAPSPLAPWHGEGHRAGWTLWGS